MYSIVLMLALGGSAETPNWCRGCFGCCGCFGCNCGGFVCNGCYGCCGCHSRWNCNGCCNGRMACNGCSGYMIVPGQAAPEQIQQPKRKQETSTSAPATLIVTLPAEATLTIDDRPTEAKSPTRVFVTPALPRTGQFTYTLKAQITRDGQATVMSRQVAVRGGQQTFVQMVFPAMEVTVAGMEEID